MEKPIPTLLLLAVLSLSLFPANSPAFAADKPDPKLVAQGKALFQTKICFTCHQTDPKVPVPVGLALKAPPFIGDFWGKEREVQINADPEQPAFVESGKTEKVKLDDAYFLESVEKPFAKIFKGAIPGMAPLPTTLEERKALLAYVKSLSKKTGTSLGDPSPEPTPETLAQATPTSSPEGDKEKGASLGGPSPEPTPETLAQATPTSSPEGEKIFGNLCAACHTIGRGKLVGPDLSGVTSRREKGWLRRQIKEPDRMIAEKDPVIMELLKQSNNVPMVPMGLTDAQVEEVIAYLVSTENQASVATAVPAPYIPTILISIVVLIGLTSIGLTSGKKKVDVM